MPPVSSVLREERFEDDTDGTDEVEDGDATETEDAEKSLDDIIDAYTKCPGFE